MTTSNPHEPGEPDPTPAATAAQETGSTTESAAESSYTPPSTAEPADEVTPPVAEVPSRAAYAAERTDEATVDQDTDDIPVGMQGLAPSARMLFHLQALMRLVTVQIPMSLALGIGAAMFGGPIVGLTAGAVAAFSFFLLALWYPSLSFDRWGYELREEELLIKRGVLFKSLTAIPTARVQHVDTRQGPLEQWIGLARVQIYTAAGMGADGVIPGLYLDDAEALRDELVRRHGDDGV